MQNNLSDLNNHLFAQLELLNSGELDDKALERELKKSKALTSLSTQILNIARLQISAIKAADSCGLRNADLPSLIATKDSRAAEDEREKTKQKLLGGNR